MDILAEIMKAWDHRAEDHYLQLVRSAIVINGVHKMRVVPQWQRTPRMEKVVSSILIGAQQNEEAVMPDAKAHPRDRRFTEWTAVCPHLYPHTMLHCWKTAWHIRSEDGKRIFECADGHVFDETRDASELFDRR